MTAPGRVLIVGATSRIAEATSRILASRQCDFVLAGRDAARLAAVAEDLRIRGAASVKTWQGDLAERTRHADLLEFAFTSLGRVDLMLVAYGILGDSSEWETDSHAALGILDVNLISTVNLLTLAAPRFESQNSGTIAVISSVAGDRGRAANYVYGSSKAALTVFLQGLRSRMRETQVRILTIKPGRVDTPMTRNYEKNPLWASADAVARGIVRAVDRRRENVYLPGYWRPLMWIVKQIPERWFKRVRF